MRKPFGFQFLIRVIGSWNKKGLFIVSPGSCCSSLVFSTHRKLSKTGSRTATILVSLQGKETDYKSLFIPTTPNIYRPHSSRYLCTELISSLGATEQQDGTSILAHRPRFGPGPGGRIMLPSIQPCWGHLPIWYGGRPPWGGRRTDDGFRDQSSPNCPEALHQLRCLEEELNTMQPEGAVLLQLQGDEES